MISPKPFKKLVPFVNIQGIRIDYTADRESLNVSLLVSNELQSPPANITFSNYCLLMSDKEMLNRLDTPRRIFERMRTDDENVRTFSLQRSDFAIKTQMNADQGTSVYNSTHTMNKIVPETKNLYALIVSYYKVSNEEIILGNICKEVILTNGRPPAKSAFYRTTQAVPGYGPDGSIWPGSVHRYNGQLMTGNKHSPDTDHPSLEKTGVTNTKTKDFRFYKEAEALSMKSEPLSSRTPYLSEITLSRNRQGSVHGLFSFDHLRFAKENTNYGQTIQNKISLLSGAPIEDVIIYQRIVKGDASGNSLTPGRPWCCGIQETTYFKKVADLSSGLQIVSGFNNNEILNIAFVDTTTQDLEANSLEYKVELLLSDKTKESLELVAAKVSTALTRHEAAGDSLSPSDLIRMVNIYLTGVTYIFGSAAFGNLSALAWQQNLLALISGDSSDMDLVLGLVRNFAAAVSAALNPSQPASSGNAVPNSTIYRSSNDSTSRLVRVFPERLKISYKKSIGFEYVDSTIINASASIPTISYTSMDQRVAAEVAKYAVNNPNAGSINQVGFLTPTATWLRANPVVIPCTTLENSTDNFAGLIRSEMQLNPAVSLEQEKDLATNIVEILNQSGISTTQNNTNLTQMVLDAQIATPNLIDSDNYFPPDSGFVQAETPLDAAASGSSTSIVINSAASNRLASSPLLSQMVNRTVSGFSNITGLSNTLDIAGSLALQRWLEDEGIIATSDAMTNLVNFGTIVQVQYLAEYSATLGVKEQNWTLLTETVYNNAASTQKSLFCRLALISGTLDAPMMIELPILASLFILGPVPVPPMNRSPQQTFRAFGDQFRNTSRESLIYLNSSDILYANNTPIHDRSLGTQY
jgi:hypothetical protein